jgi:hypothetical protein
VVAVVVVTVRVEGVPGAAEDGLKLHVGGVPVVGVTSHVNATELLNPFSGPMVTVDVAGTPGSTAAGFNGDADTVKFG